MIRKQKSKFYIYEKKIISFSFANYVFFFFFSLAILLFFALYRDTGFEIAFSAMFCGGSILGIIKNILKFRLLNINAEQLDEDDFNLSIYFSWIRKQIGNLFYLIFWISLLLVHVFISTILFTNYDHVVPILVVNVFLGASFFYAISLVIGYFFVKGLLNHSMETIHESLPWTEGFELEIDLTKKQAQKDNINIIIIFLLIITIIPFIVFLISPGFRNWILL